MGSQSFHYSSLVKLQIWSYQLSHSLMALCFQTLVMLYLYPVISPSLPFTFQEYMSNSLSWIILFPWPRILFSQLCIWKTHFHFQNSITSYLFCEVVFLCVGNTLSLLVITILSQDWLLHLLHFIVIAFFYISLFPLRQYSVELPFIHLLMFP